MVKKSTKKTTTKKKVAAKKDSEATTTTEEPKVNKTAAIKEALAANKDKSPGEISELLKEQGIDVTPAYISTVKSKIKTGGGGAKKKTAKKKGKKAPQASLNGDVLEAGELLASAVTLVKETGVDNARKLVNLASKIVDEVQG